MVVDGVDDVAIHPQAVLSGLERCFPVLFRVVPADFNRFGELYVDDFGDVRLCQVVVVLGDEFAGGVNEEDNDGLDVLEAVEALHVELPHDYAQVIDEIDVFSEECAGGVREEGETVECRDQLRGLRNRDPFLVLLQ